MTKAPKPSKADLVPVDWPAIEPHWRAGIRTPTAISKQFGVSRAAIIKHARKYGWERNLRPDITAKADRLVAESAVTPDGQNPVTPQVTPQPLFTDAEITEAGAQQLALVRLEHREDIAMLRSIIRGLARELSLTIDAPERFGMIYDALANPDEPAIAALRDMADLINSLPARTKIAKDLADALHKCIGMEREAFGLDTEGGTNGDRYTVLIKDYTGRGDPDSPRQREKAAEEAP